MTHRPEYLRLRKVTLDTLCRTIRKSHRLSDNAFAALLARTDERTARLIAMVHDDA